ncbi:MAG: adenylyl-sulfate kinase [Mariprofundaceae bacterium]|nr:adenylyl-sulfate kinase [Mariprofundaceae bacterium]
MKLSPFFQKGFCLWFTGLSGAGKSTVSSAVHHTLREHGIANVELLDGDEVRTHLTHGLGFSRADRDTNVLRIGWVCQLLVKHSVPVMTAAISPYRETRNEVRTMVERVGGKGAFIEVFVNASVEECARRDVKGLYAKAMAGEIPQFTGVSDPYEPPEQAEIELNTASESEEESVVKVVRYLDEHAYISGVED